jgi:hypothetical protein
MTLCEKYPTAGGHLNLIRDIKIYELENGANLNRPFVYFSKAPLLMNQYPRFYLEYSFTADSKRVISGSALDESF